MELTPQVLRNAQFRQAFRGYDPDDVDDLLERAAVSLGQILHRLQAAEAGAGGSAAMPPPAPAALAGEALDSRQIDEELRRTLQLAQRTADSVVAEANEEAAAKLVSADDEASGLMAEAEAERDRVLNSARGEADRMVEDAQSYRSGLLDNAEAEVAAEADELRGRIAAEVEQLQTARDVLRSDIDGLENHLEGRRGQLASVIERLQTMLDDPESLRALEPPPLAPVALPDVLTKAQLTRDKVRSDPETAGAAELVDAASAAAGLGNAGEAPEAVETAQAAPEPDDQPPVPPPPASTTEEPFAPKPFEPPLAEAAVFDTEPGRSEGAPSAAEVAANAPVDTDLQQASEDLSAPDLAATIDRLPRLTPSTPPVGPDASEPAEPPSVESATVEDPSRPRASLFEPPPATTGLDQVPLDELRSLARDIPGNTPPPAPGPVWEDQGGPPTEAVPAIDDDDADPFLDELKKAVEED
ncbi:MAG: DivIVA domain-containing protein [Actinomycetia bacterium]|nr:DivIVA domain-containing protein [Actinomycetes bacterium]